MDEVQPTRSTRALKPRGTPADRRPTTIAAAIRTVVYRAGGSLSQRDLRRRLQRYSVTDLEAIIDDMVSAGTLTRVLRPPPTGHGPHSRILTLTPFKVVEPASIEMQMRPAFTEAEKEPPREVTAHDLAQVAGAVQKARIIMQERPHCRFDQALLEALWDRHHEGVSP